MKPEHQPMAMGAPNGPPPTVGRIVHYYPGGDMHGWLPGPIAAIVTYTDGYLADLIAFPPSGHTGRKPVELTLVEYREAGPGWRWPPLVENRPRQKSGAETQMDKLSLFLLDRELLPEEGDGAADTAMRVIASFLAGESMGKRQTREG